TTGGPLRSSNKPTKRGKKRAGGKKIKSAPALHLGFSLVLLWGLLFFCWDEYRLDALRDKLFSLRHRLFMAAVEGHIAFDDPTYQQLRILMNGMIRFGHKLTFGRL